MSPVADTAAPRPNKVAAGDKTAAKPVPTDLRNAKPAKNASLPATGKRTREPSPPFQAHPTPALTGVQQKPRQKTPAAPPALKRIRKGSPNLESTVLTPAAAVAGKPSATAPAPIAAPRGSHPQLLAADAAVKLAQGKVAESASAIASELAPEQTAKAVPVPVLTPAAPPTASPTAPLAHACTEHTVHAATAVRVAHSADAGVRSASVKVKKTTAPAPAAARLCESAPMTKQTVSNLAATSPEPDHNKQQKPAPVTAAPTAAAEASIDGVVQPSMLEKKSASGAVMAATPAVAAIASEGADKSSRERLPLADHEGSKAAKPAATSSPQPAQAALLTDALHTKGSQHRSKSQPMDAGAVPVLNKQPRRDAVIERVEAANAGPHAGPASSSAPSRGAESTVRTTPAAALPAAATAALPAARLPTVLPADPQISSKQPTPTEAAQSQAAHGHDGKAATSKAAPLAAASGMAGASKTAVTVSPQVNDVVQPAGTFEAKAQAMPSPAAAASGAFPAAELSQTADTKPSTSRADPKTVPHAGRAAPEAKAAKTSEDAQPFKATPGPLHRKEVNPAQLSKAADIAASASSKQGTGIAPEVPRAATKVRPLTRPFDVIRAALNRAEAQGQ